MNDSDKGRIKSLLDEYMVADEEVGRLTALLQTAEEVRSRKVKEVKDICGASNPLITHQGKELGRIVVRTNKSRGTETYFFRGSSSNSLDL